MDYREYCLRFYNAARLWVAPTLRTRSYIRSGILSHVTAGGKWLDLGCGHHVLPPWRHERERSLTRMPQLMVGLDYDARSLRKHKTIRNLVRGDISRLPFSTDTFDLVTANMVFEHLADPEEQLEEVFRILKPGGSLIFHTPNSRGYGIALARVVPESLKAKAVWLLERRREEDFFPTYYRINIRDNHSEAGEASGLQSAVIAVDRVQCVIHYDSTVGNRRVTANTVAPDAFYASSQNEHHRSALETRPDEWLPTGG